MDEFEIIKVLEKEMECVKRQDGPKCPRLFGITCAVCDLIIDTSKVLDAFQGAIDALKRDIAEKEKADADREALEEAHRLDEKEATVEGRFHI